MAGSQISTSVTIISSLLGFEAISLTNLAGSALTAIAAGSKVEIAGGFFTFDSDLTPSGWTAIGTAHSGYIALTPSGSAGSQVVSAEWTNTTPIWSDSKQGWYQSAGSIVRYVAAAQKISNTAAGVKTVFKSQYGDSSARYLYRVQLGEWNMDATAAYTIDIPEVDAVSLISADAWVREDQIQTVGLIFNEGEAGWWQLTNKGGGGLNVAGFTNDILRIAPQRTTGGFFDNANYNATAGTLASRGFINLWYTVPIV